MEDDEEERKNFISIFDLYCQRIEGRETDVQHLLKKTQEHKEIV